MRFNVAMLFILLVLSSNAIQFSRKFGFGARPDMTNLTRTARKPSTLTRIANIGLIPKIPPQLSESSSQRIVAQQENERFDICKTQQPCANNGFCIAEGNSFYCECPPQFYGKACDILADERNCENNFCENNSTCYSIDHKRSASSILQKDSLQVSYMCWCKKGFYGDFCDYSEEMREYSEDYCNHHGIVNVTNFNAETKRTCHCEEYYSGPNCEIVSPCRDFECINGGSCKINSTDQPYCECPTSLQLSPAFKVYGDHCETIWFPDNITANECRPCATNFADYIKCLEQNEIGKQSLSYLWTPCEIFRPGCFDEYLSKFNCFNDVNVSESNSITLAVPRCECKLGYEGMFCERRVLNACERLSDADKCVHGKCALDLETLNAKCLCEPNYHGLKCELEKPCASHECGDAMCIEVPVNDKMSEYKFPLCVCNSNQLVKNNTLQCSNPVFAACQDQNRVPKCKNDAYCYPCLLDNEKNSVMNACSDEEWNRGFRCICTPGFMPPFCEKRIGPCDFNQCMNNAKCVPLSNNTLEYSCSCQKGYSGKYCEQSHGACARSGHICKQGICVNDVHFRRGFRCNCKEGYSGIDCDREKTMTIIDFYNENYAWSYPLTLFILLSIILIISLAVQEYVKRRMETKESLQDVESIRHEEQSVQNNK